MKAPAFQFYPSDWLGSQRVALMTLEEEGAYIRALAFCWGQGGVPEDPQKLAFLIGKGASTTVATTVASMLEPHPTRPGYLISPRMEEVRARTAEWLKKSAEGGRKSGETRRLKGALTTVGTKIEPPFEPPFEPNGQPNANTPSPSPSPMIKERKRFIPPTQAEMELHAAKIGLPVSEIEGFFAHHKARGWMLGKLPMRSWSAAMVTWKLNWSKFSKNGTGPRVAINSKLMSRSDQAYQDWCKEQEAKG